VTYRTLQTFLLYVTFTFPIQGAVIELETTLDYLEDLTRCVLHATKPASGPVTAEDFDRAWSCCSPARKKILAALPRDKQKEGQEELEKIRRLALDGMKP